MNGRTYLADAVKRFQESRTQCERAMAQVPADLWHVRLDPESNSLDTLLLHLSGNLISRWSAFLQSDGEKPDRDRDSEFEDAEGLSQQALMDRWNRGWTCLFEALAGLSEGDLDLTVTIRSQPLTVVEAINRQLAHYAYHAGQVVFLSKHLSSGREGGHWQTLSIARRGSEAFNTEMVRKRQA